MSREPSIFGKKLREARTRPGHERSQQDLALLIREQGLKCSRSAIAMIESGKMSAFDDDAYCVAFAKVFGNPADEWREWAKRSRSVFKLTGAGKGVTEDHRVTGELLMENWANLSPQVLRAIRATVLHQVGNDPATEPEPAAGNPKRGRSRGH